MRHGKQTDPEGGLSMRNESSLATDGVVDDGPIVITNGDGVGQPQLVDPRASTNGRIPDPNANTSAKRTDGDIASKPANPIYPRTMKVS